MSFRGTLFGGFRRSDVLTYIEERAKAQVELQHRLEEANKEADGLRANVSALTGVIDQLNAQVDEQRELHEEIERMREECAELREREAEAQQDALLAEQQLDSLRRTIEELEDDAEALRREKQEVLDRCARLERERATCADIEIEARTRAADVEVAAQEKIAALYAETDVLLRQLIDCLTAAAVDSRDAARQAVDRTQEAEQDVDRILHTIDEQVRQLQDALPTQEEAAAIVEGEVSPEEVAAPVEAAVSSTPVTSAAPVTSQTTAPDPPRLTSELRGTLTEVLRLLRRKN